MKWVVAIFAGVLLLRLGFWLLRMVGGTLAELTAARGTPIALGAALVFLAALVFAFLRRRRR